jgi:hypothetical protein
MWKRLEVKEEDNNRHTAAVYNKRRRHMMKYIVVGIMSVVICSAYRSLFRLRVCRIEEPVMVFLGIG